MGGGERLGNNHSIHIVKVSAQNISWLVSAIKTHRGLENRYGAWLFHSFTSFLACEFFHEISVKQIHFGLLLMASNGILMCG